MYTILCGLLSVKISKFFFFFFANNLTWNRHYLRFIIAVVLIVFACLTVCKLLTIVCSIEAYKELAHVVEAIIITL